MKVFIPSRGRPEVRTLDALHGAGDCKIVCSSNDPTLPEYVALHGKKKLLVLEATGIVDKRQQILEACKREPLLMIDDDMRFYRRSKDGASFKPCDAIGAKAMLQWFEKALVGHAHAGLMDKFMGQHAPRGARIGSQRYNQVLGYNPALFPKDPKPKFRLATQEEHDMHLQLATRGLPPIISQEFTKESRSYANGGCSGWRTNAVEEEGQRKLAALWPDYITLVDSAHTISNLAVRFKWRNLNENL